MEQSEPVLAVGAEDHYRRTLRLRAEKDIDRNMTAEYDNAVKERNQ